MKQKRFKCDICDKGFASKYYQKSHMENNLCKKKLIYQCGICHSNFKERHLLIAHIAIVHEGKKAYSTTEIYNCNICEYAFHNKQHLKSHVDSVHAGKVIY